MTLLVSGHQERTAAGTHPRLLFTQEDIPVLKAKLSTEIGSNLWQRIKARAERGLTEDVPVWSRVQKQAPRSKRLKIREPRPTMMFVEHTGNKLWAFSMAYVLTGNREYQDLAKRWLLAIADWPDWADNDSGLIGLGYSHTMGGFSFSYDCLYSALSAEERERCRSTLRREAERQYQAAPSKWWAWTVLQNHGWWHAASEILPALVLEGEIPREETDRWLEEGMAYARLLHQGTRGMVDGSWPEGQTYQQYAMQAFSGALYALSRNKNFDIWEDNQYLRSFPKWRLYNFIPATPDRQFMTYGDISGNGRRTVHAAMPCLLSAWRYRDGHAVWLARELLKIQDDWFPEDEMVKSLVFYDPKIEPIPPDELPLNLHLKELEGVIFRSSWEKDGLMFGLKCGPYGGRWNFDLISGKELPYNQQKRAALGHRITASEYSMGHSHRDAGTFWINWKGVMLTSKVSGYGTSDTYQHNTVVVNGENQFKCDDRYAGDATFVQTGASTPVMISGDDYSFCVADAGPRYMNEETGQNPLEEFTRHVLYVRRDDPGYFVIADRLVARAPGTFEWMCHLSGNVTREQDWIRGQTEDGLGLGVKVLSPTAYTYGTGALSNRGRANNPVPRTVRISNPERTTGLRFITLLWPTNADNWEQRPVAQIVKEDGTALSLRVRVGDREDVIDLVYGVRGTASLR
jgi:hypothetical protein